MTKKKFEVKGIEEALARLPENQRADALKAIEDFTAQLESGEGDLPGEPVRNLPAGTSICPDCGGPLRVDAAGVAIPDSEVVDFLECPKCERAFATPAAS